MKTILKLVKIGLICNLGLCAAFRAQANFEVGVSVQINARADFDVPLAAHGTWVSVNSYGRCWHPAGVVVGWRPYCDGQWIWTDCGWYWQSDEAWAWACYHYGRWVYATDVGWVWAPDIEWAPAWVYWRTGGGYIGWAPCPPRGVVIEPALFAFVEVDHFRDNVRPQTVVVNNTTIINKTTVINNNIRQETRTIDGSSRKVYVNEGPGVEVVQKAGSSSKVSAVPIQEVARRTPAPAALLQKPGKSVSQESTPQVLPKKEPSVGARVETPAKPISRESTPQTLPKKEPPARELAEPPAKTITSNTAPAKSHGQPPGKVRHREHLMSPGGSTLPPAAPPAKPAEPVGGKNDQGQREDKAQGHDKDKP